MKKILLVLYFMSTIVQSAGLSGLNFETYRGTGATPNYINLTYPTPLSTGVSPTINYSWGGGNILNSGRSEQVIVRWAGYINIPTAGTYYFGGSADDGIIIKVNNSTVVNSWREDGGTMRVGNAITLSAGAVPIEVWYYENGGGAIMNLQWYVNNTWQIVPTTVLATDSTYWVPSAPVLCCGGSSASFSASSTNVAKVNTFVTRTTSDSQIYVEQIGNFNVTNIQQSGTKNNYVKYYVNGSSNTTSINQSGNSSTQTNYVDLNITGNSNTTAITQTSTGGGKGVFVNATNNNNVLNIQQTDSGNHYAELNVTGGNKTVSINQGGTAGHMANVTMSGNPSSLSLTQSGSTQQFYSITHNCATAGGCAAITVNQGQ